MRKYFLSILLSFCCATALLGQTDTIRYVKTDGTYAGDGKSWATAKNDVQSAINDLRDYLTKNNLHSGSVYVAAGTYRPTESTETSETGTLFTAFKIYDGIHVYGGFSASAPETRPSERALTDGTAIGARAAGSEVNTWQMKNVTVFTGNHSTTGSTTFTFDKTRNRYTTRFPGNSYHVVWFATNGFIGSTRYAQALSYGASVDGVTIQEGNAANKSTTSRSHASCGGGVYMVGKSALRNCIVTQCAAALRGGGVYMDGGGTVDRCYVNTCQTLGVGVTDGYGGGVCIDYDGVVTHSYISQNVARVGGGLVISHQDTTHPLGTSVNRYTPRAVSCVVSNNTASTEAGGIMLDNGGTLNHLTVTRNNCPGSAVTYNGRKYGRTGGLYINNGGMSYNTVVWGNTCAANKDIQYAAFTRNSTSGGTDAIQPYVYYTAFSQHDITDWSGTLKYNVYSLDEANQGETAANYAMFHNPASESGAAVSVGSLNDWRPYPVSYLSERGIQVSELTVLNDYIKKANAADDILGSAYQAVSMLGALNEESENIEHVTLPSVEPGDNGEQIPTLFVDAGRVITDPTVKVGGSWEHPLGNISKAIQYFKEKYFDQKVQVLVKQGEYTVAGPSSYLNTEMRTASLRMRSNIRLFGGYPQANTGTQTTGRNPKEYSCRISGDVSNSGFVNNSAHIINFVNVKDAVVDGFMLYYGNSVIDNSVSVPNGGGVLVSNLQVEEKTGGRIDMTGNILRNCVIANCYAPEGGGAVYLNGTLKKSDGSVSRAELRMENCVIHNNSAVNTETGAQSGVITSAGNSSLVMEHCTVVSNAGYPLETRVSDGHQGAIEVNRSAFYANTVAEMENRQSLTESSLAPFTGSGITGTRNLIDKNYGSVPAGFVDSKAVFLNNSADDTSYPDFVNVTRNIGPRRNLDDNTVYGGTPDFMPTDMNPMVNACATADTQTDLTGVTTRNHGGLADVGALENTYLPEYQGVIYVRNRDGRDAEGYGASWQKAYKTIGYALTQAKAANAAAAGSVTEIWVAAGTYKELVVMVEGVNVYGGFKAYGNPGKRADERDVSNHLSDYQTIIDANARGRALVQNADFTTETTWEGFTVQNGAYGQMENVTSKSGTPQVSYGDWSDSDHGTRTVTTVTTTTRTMTWHPIPNDVFKVGIGVNLMRNGVLRNCLVRNNVMNLRNQRKQNITDVVTETRTQTEVLDAVGGTSVLSDGTITEETNTTSTDGQLLSGVTGFDIGGAGVATTEGSKVLNCVIRNNVIQGNANAAGVGVFMNGGTIANSMIVENYADGGAYMLGVGAYIEALLRSTAALWPITREQSALPSRRQSGMRP